ncbi:MAG: hypothetical protein ACRDV1_05425 [Actinomycetes bacterium]
MAKALVGHVGGLDPLVAFEVRRLRERVRDLESEVLRLRSENDTLAAGVGETDLIALDVNNLDVKKTPALA